MPEKRNSSNRGKLQNRLVAKFRVFKKILRNYLVSDRAQKIQRQLKIQYSDTLELKDLLLTTTFRSPRYYGPFFGPPKRSYIFL